MAPIIAAASGVSFSWNKLIPLAHGTPRLSRCSKHFHSMLTIEGTDVVYLFLAGQLDTLTVFLHSGDNSVVRCHYWVHREIDCLLIPQVFTRSPPLTTTCWWGSRKHVGQLCKMPWSNTCVPRDRILVPVKCRDLMLR